MVDFEPEWLKLLENNMIVREQALESVIPDLREISLDSLVEMDDSVLANSIALYRQRLQSDGVTVYRFTSSV